MKNIIIAVFALFIIASCEKENKNSGDTDVLVSMGANYVNDVFYSLEENSAHQVSRTNWDIAFGTYVMSPSIIINGGNGVKLYELSKDTSDWYNTVDTTGMVSWTNLNNSNASWDIGAFSGNMGGGFNFGWGIYNHSTKNVNGAALFLIKLSDGSLKKIFIRQKNGIQNTIYFLYANIDGTNEQLVALANNTYAGKE